KPEILVWNSRTTYLDEQQRIGSNCQLSRKSPPLPGRASDTANQLMGSISGRLGVVTPGVESGFSYAVKVSPAFDGGPIWPIKPVSGLVPVAPNTPTMFILVVLPLPAIVMATMSMPN